MFGSLTFLFLDYGVHIYLDDATGRMNTWGFYMCLIYYIKKSNAQNVQKWLNHVIWHKEGKAGLYVWENSLRNGLGSWTSGSLWCHIYLWCNRATPPAAKENFRISMNFRLSIQWTDAEKANALRTRITMARFYRSNACIFLVHSFRILKTIYHIVEYKLIIKNQYVIKAYRNSTTHYM